MALVSALQIAEAMGGAKTLRGREIRTDSELQKAVEEGLPKSVLPAIFQNVVGPGEAAQFTHRVVPRATYARRKNLNKTESERAEQIARVIASAEYVWNSHEDAKWWLNTEHPELDGQTPLEMSLSSVGARRVEELLNKILHGLPV